ncbi:MAG: putative DNA binding domain-containing protein, partial [Spirochaetales bacterium]|nr:putative DNA binding domain-containing protein [Spirochaetales bacterium]
MSTLHSSSDIKKLSEGIDLECKLAAGKNGKGELPKKTFWESYSAFANTNGGIILLGVKEEKDHSFTVVGVSDTQKILDELWTSANNPQTISCNLLTEEIVSVVTIEGKEIIKIEVPRASRHFRPVYRASNPLAGTYQRLHSSDVKCSNETVKRMLAEQVEDSRDDKLLEKFDLKDLDSDTLKRYRIMYSNREPENTRVEYSDIEFLRSIGGWKRDRDTGKEGLTIAGLLMFGNLMPIQEVFPNYLLDYQERDQNSDVRWVDRVSLDGSWSGNIFDFYLKVGKKLIADLKIPFKLIGDQSENSTHIHDAIREAFVNSLVHADYTGKASVLAVKNSDSFNFRNPGLMRISVEQAINGYEHDCRNQKMHQMFHFLGLGERAGSGIPNIFKWWG